MAHCDIVVITILVVEVLNETEIVSLENLLLVYKVFLITIIVSEMVYTSTRETVD